MNITNLSSPVTAPLDDTKFDTPDEDRHCVSATFRLSFFFFFFFNQFNLRKFQLNAPSKRTITSRTPIVRCMIILAVSIVRR